MNNSKRFIGFIKTQGEVNNHLPEGKYKGVKKSDFIKKMNFKNGYKKSVSDNVYYVIFGIGFYRCPQWAPIRYDFN